MTSIPMITDSDGGVIDLSTITQSDISRIMGLCAFAEVLYQGVTMQKSSELAQIMHSFSERMDAFMDRLSAILDTQRIVQNVTGWSMGAMIAIFGLITLGSGFVALLPVGAAGAGFSAGAAVVFAKAIKAAKFMVNLLSTVVTGITSFARGSLDLLRADAEGQFTVVSGSQDFMLTLIQKQTDHLSNGVQTQDSVGLGVAMMIREWLRASMASTRA